MAASTSLRLLKFKNIFNTCQSVSGVPVSSNVILVRCLRGSRYSKDDNQEELKFQRMLRRIRNDKIESSASSIPFPTSPPENIPDESFAEPPQLVTSEDLIKRLEEKIAPLEGLLYTRQLERKYKKSLTVLRSLGEKLHSLKVPIAMGSDKLPCPVELTLPSPVTECYRNKDEFNIGLGLDGVEKTVGFFLDTPTEYSTTFCISPKDLSMVRESHKRFAEDFQNFLLLSSLPASQHFADDGVWKKLIVRSNQADELMGIVVMHPQNLTQEEIQVEKDNLKSYFMDTASKEYNLKSLYFQLCTQSKSTHEQSPFQLILGQPTISEKINNFTVNFSPDSFLHVNTKAHGAMLNILLKLCRVNKSTTVLDIYCGPGPISFMFSPRVKKCIGIDDSTQAISDAKLNAKENGLLNTEFFCGRPEHLIRNVLSSDYHEDVLAVLNNSKSATNKSVITCLREFKNLKKLVYISTKPSVALDDFVRLCKPGGSARNLGKAFVPILAVPVDLYPQTDQYGLIVMFQRIAC